MNLLTVSNLFPRPDQPARGLFNRQLFDELARLCPSRNVCLVPEWRVWRWPRIRGWPEPEAAGVPTRYVPVFYLPVVGRSTAHAFYARPLAAAVRREPAADVVYAAWLYPDGAAAATVAKAQGKRLWLMALGSDTLHLNHAARRSAVLQACAEAEGVVCVARLLADRLRAAGVSPDKLHVIPNGVDPERFRFVPRDDAARQLAERLPSPAVSLETSSRPPIVLFVGNMVSVKGPDILLDAWQTLRSRFAPTPRRSDTPTPPHPDTPTLILIGDGPLRPRLERQAREGGLADAVRFLGVRPHEEIPLWMNAADCLCLTSRSEGMPNAVNEALACGLPVVAADVGACGEMLGGKAVSRVVPPGNAQAFADAVEAVLRSEVDRAALARQYGGYSWHDQAERIWHLMERGR